MHDNRRQIITTIVFVLLMAVAMIIVFSWLTDRNPISERFFAPDRPL